MCHSFSVVWLYGCSNANHLFRVVLKLSIRRVCALVSGNCYLQSNTISSIEEGYTHNNIVFIDHTESPGVIIDQKDLYGEKYTER